MKRLASLVLTLALCIGLAVPALAAEFSDVPANHWAYSAIQSADEKGVASGYSDGTFRPTASVTRAQFCVMLSRAFYPGEVEALTTDENKAQGWFVPNTLALKNAGLLDGVSNFKTNYNKPSYMGQEISRFDMAQLVTNIMKSKGFTASDEQKAAVQSKISDYTSTVNGYQDAVKNVYALGIIGGYDDGSFKGFNIMNRAQGCVVLERLANCIGQNSGSTSARDPNETQKDAPSDASREDPSASAEAPKPTTVDVTNSSDSAGIAWSVPDNGYGTGYLNNGKAITEENIAAMLTEAEKLWPTGMTWTDKSAGASNNYYANPGKVVNAQFAKTGTFTSTYYGCGGFSAVISDYLFGKTANPMRELTDMSQIHAGDIVVAVNKKTGILSHVMIATSGAHSQSNGQGDSFSYTNGNSGKQVDWDCGMLVRLLDSGTALNTYRVFTRWP